MHQSITWPRAQRARALLKGMRTRLQAHLARSRLLALPDDMLELLVAYIASCHDPAIRHIPPVLALHESRYDRPGRMVIHGAQKGRSVGGLLQERCWLFKCASDEFRASNSEQFKSGSTTCWRRGRRSTRAMLASVAPLLDQHATTVLCRSRACKAVFELESSLPYCSPTNGPPTHQPSPSAYSCRPPLAHYSLVHVTGELSFMLRTERSERSRRGGSPRRRGRAGDQSKTTPHRSAVRCVRRPRPPIPVTGRERYSERA